MINTANKISKETSKNSLAVLIDMSKCAVKYGSGYCDYDFYKMYEMNDQQRDTVLTVRKNNELVIKYCQKEYFHFFDRKCEFDLKFAKYLKRDFIDVDTNRKEDVINFVKKHPTFFAKTNEGCGGLGVKKIRSVDYDTLDDLYQYLVNKDLLLEEEIKQHKDIAIINPNTINTIRIVTILKDNKVHVLFAALRVGSGSHDVDNLHSEGYAARVDIKSGKVCDLAFDKKRVFYKMHPQTNIQFEGFQIPMWKETIAMVEEACKVVPQIAYVGWDVAISDKGPVFVEGNTFPGNDIYLKSPQKDDKIGMWPTYNI